MTTLPAIRKTNRFARGLTVNIAQEERADRYRLEVWSDGDPVIEELHDSPHAAVHRLAELYVGGALGSVARSVVEGLFRRQ